MSQKERILDILRRGIISNHELRRLNPPIYQYPTRIKELRDQGYQIITRQDKSNKKTFWYELIEEINWSGNGIQQDLSIAG